MFCVKCKREIPDESAYCLFCGTNQKTPKPKRKSMKRANGTGSVYKNTGRRKRPWIAAKGGVVIGYYETKTAALEALGRLAGRDITERYNMTFAQVYEAWSSEHFRSVGIKGKEAYENAYRIFEPLHKRNFRQLKTADFQTVLDKHMHKSHSTVSKYKQLINQMSEWAIREELITSNFASFVQLPQAEKKEKEIFSDAEIHKLENDGSETARIVLMLIGTGMRIGELFSLPLDSYFGTHVVWGSKTESGKNRIIPINPAARPHFEHFAKKATGALLISGHTGQVTVDNFRNREYYPLLDALGIQRKTPHATRHTYASRARSRGVPAEMLQKILGHADYSTTANIYIHAEVDELLKAVEQQPERL